MKSMLTNLHTLIGRRAARLIVVFVLSLMLTALATFTLRAVRAGALGRLGIKNQPGLAQLLEGASRQANQTMSRASSPRSETTGYSVAAPTATASYLYVLNNVNGASNQIYGYQVNEATGTLTALSGFPISTGGNGDNSATAYRLAVDTANLRLYAVNNGSNTVSAYSINSGTGALTALPFSPIALPSNVFNWLGVYVHPSGSPLIVTSGDGATTLHLASFNITASTATAASGSPYNTGTLYPVHGAFSTNGNYFYAGGGTNLASYLGYSVNSSTGVLTALAGSPFTTTGIPRALATDTSGRLFTKQSANLYGFTTSSGLPTGFSGNPFSGTTGDTFFDASQGLMHPNGFYLVTTGKVWSFKVNGTGAATTLTTVSGSPYDTVSAHNMALNQAGSFLFVGNSTTRSLTTYAVSPSTGVLSSPVTQPGNSNGSSGAIGGLAGITATAPTLGNYSATTMALSAQATVTPDAAPTSTTSITAKASSGFNGTFDVNPATGVVKIINAHPAGTHTVTVTAFSANGSTSKTFTLTVQSGTACATTPLFTAGTSFNGGSAFYIPVGDFNNDGKQDLAIANNGSSSVSIRLGDGAGGFTSGGTVSTASQPSWVAVGDFNGDGNQDLAVACSTSVSIRLGDGAGNFSGATNVSTGGSCISVAVGDFNGDGKLDFVTANTSANTASVRLGDGAGGFTGTANVSVGGGPGSVVVGDFDNDGDLDFASSNQTPGTVSIRLNNGAGTFSGSTEITVGSDPEYMELGDFNEDGKLDFVASNNGSGTISIRFGDGAGGFTGSTNTTIGSSTAQVVVADLNNDGNQDIAVRRPNFFHYLLGDGLGGFGAPVSVSVPNTSSGYCLILGDFNQDGRQDLIADNLSTGTLYPQLGGCNAAPTITAGAPLTRQQGATGTSATIATVSDTETAAGSLTVMAAAPTGITVTGITNTSGTITATVTAACNATIGANTVVLTVTDGNGATATANLTVNVTAATAPTTAAAGPDQTLCATAPATLAANTPSVGTGAWSIVSGPSLSTAQFNSLSNPAATFTPAGGVGTYTLRWTITGACAISTDDVVLTYNALPTITLGASPSVLPGSTSANLTYSATTGSPNQYSIDYNAAANTAGFVDVTNASLTASPIVLTVPGAAASATYNATLTVRNSTTGCVSSSTAFTVTISNCPSLLTVNDLGDGADASPGNGICETATGNGICTLRAAIQEANALTACSPMTINFSLNGTITLGSALPAIGHPNLTITGNGAANTVISGNNTVAGLSVTAAGRTLALSNLTITNANSTANGAALNISGNNDTLTLTNCVLSNNTTTTNGGGLYLAGTGTTAMLTNTTVSGNTAANGGGLYVSISTLTFNNGTISGNTGTAGSGGGVLVTNGATLNANESLFSNNSSSIRGAGIASVNLSNVNVARCTFTGNSGSGVINSSLTTNITNSTISGNTGTGIDAVGGTTTVTNSTFGANTGTNVFASSLGTVLNLVNTLVAGNSSCVQSTQATINATNSLIQGGLSCVNGTNTNNLTSAPLLGTLGNYGGTTQTVPLLPGSPAINAGTSSGAPTSDQRGIARVGNVDIGAFESRGFTLAVNSGNNQSTAAGSAFGLPLSVTVTSANGEPVNGGQVTFTPPASGASCTLASNPATIATGAASSIATANTTIGANYTVSAAANGATSINFSLTNLNSAPTFTPAAAISRQQGAAAGAAVTVGTAADGQTAAGSLTVTQIAGGTATGITVASITNTGGTITAVVTADCTATPGTVRFQVSDGSLTGTGDLQVNVTAATAPTTAAAGSDQIFCATAPATLAANTPGAGTGAWSIVSGPSLLTSQFNSLSNPAATFTPTGGIGTYTLRWTITGACATSTDDVVLTYNAVPTITLGANPSVLPGVTGANLTYSATTGSPNQYSIDYNAAANTAGFVDVTNASLTASPIVLVVPGAAASATYNATLTVRNSMTGCAGSSTAFTVTISNCPSLFTVNDLGDGADASPGNGVCATTGGVCTLRAAIQEANALTACSPLTINFSVNGTILLGNALPAIAHPNLTITGNGAANTIISGNNTVAGLSVTAANITLALNNLTVTNANSTTDGAALNFAGDNGVLTLTDCVLSNSTTTATGGGLYLAGTGTTVTLNTTSISGNTASGSGGGAQISGGTLTLNGCTISGNSGNGGGGVMIGTATLNANNSQFSNNVSSTFSGAAFASQSLSAIVNVTGCTFTGHSGISTFTTNGAITITNSTFSGNLSVALNAFSSTTTVINSTFSGNNSNVSASNSGTVLNLVNTIVANATNGSSSNCQRQTEDATINAQHSLIAGSLSCVNGTNTNNLTADPVLSALGNYGGTTQTFALLPGSPAINAGTSTGAPATDQRRIARVGNVDIGAFESRGFTMAVGGGNNQSAVTNTAFADPLSLTVTSAAGEPVNGGQVTFTPPGSGAGCALATNPATIFGGAASSTATANAVIGGPYTVSAAANGATSVNFSLTNLNSAPSFTPAAAISRQQGTPAGAAVTIGTVADAQTSAGSLTVTQIAGGTATGVTVASITNTGGTITAIVTADCTATPGTVRFQVSDGSLTNTGDLTVNVTTNDAPSVVYGNIAVNGGASTTNSPATATDNGLITGYAVLSQGSFTGTISVNASGAVSIGNAAPVGNHTITIRATDNCGATTDANFTLAVGNNAPTITPGATLSRQQGSAGTTATIATVNDGETPIGSLTVTATTVPTGLTVTGISNSGGTITATVAAGCTATVGANTVVLTVTDSNGGTAMANLTVNVAANSAPSVTYGNVSVNAGASTTNSPTTASDNGLIASYAVQSQGTYTGTISVNASGTVSIGNATPVGNHTITIRATDNCGATTDAQFTLSIGNNLPTITPSAALTRQQGSPGSTATIAAVSDNDTPLGNLIVNATTVPTGITVTGITNNNGTITANIAAGCNATVGANTIVLSVTDADNGTSTGGLTVNVSANSAPTLTYPAADVAMNAATTVSPTSNTDSGSITGYQIISVTPPLTTAPTINGSGVISITDAAPFGTHTITVRATDNCGATTDVSFTLNVGCGTITLPAIINGLTFVPYNFTFTASGGSGSYSYTLASGTLPPGLSLNGNILSGTPNTAGASTFTLRATDDNGCFGERTYTLLIGSTGLKYYPLARPVRLLDTRPGLSPNACFQPNAPIPGNTARLQPARGTCEGLTIPANATTITGNITTVQSGGGFLTIYPSDAPQPLVANSNYNPNEILNNAFTVGVGAKDGAVKIFVTSTTDVVVDVTGYYAPPEAGGLYFHPLPRPVRLLETRAGFSGCFAPGQPLPGGANTPQLGTGSCQGLTIPSDALALVGNATTVNPQGGGYLTLYPANAAQPLVASSNYAAGQVVNGPFTVGLSPSGQFNIFTLATTDLVVDITGYYSAQANDPNGQGLLFTSLGSPLRLLDTRAGEQGCYTPGAPMTTGTVYTQETQSPCTNLTPTARALIGNATVVNTTGEGYLTFWPADATQPLVATSNYVAGQVFNRYFTVGLSGSVSFKRFASRTTDLVIDISGFFAP